tara:strand:+ start:2894 stop:3265 length:372 start_codon:yes stop_codon:yes gene_type:complete
MNILFLDDDNERIRQFRTKIPGAVVVKTAEQAIKALQKEDIWNIVFLDHDLGGEEFVDSNREDCGMEVVRWIIKKDAHIRNIIVHTHNTPAGEYMTALLKEALYETNYVPFGTLINNLEMAHG